MPKKCVYSPEEKKRARRILLIHGGDIAIVHQLTTIPERTLRHWRKRWDDDYELYSNALAGNSLLPAMANPAPKQPAIPKAASGTTFAEHNDSLAEYTQLRQKLMEHTTTLANDLLRGDGPVHQRVQALSRLLDRILALDELLPAAPTPEPLTDPPEQPEQTIRFESRLSTAIPHHRKRRQGRRPKRRRKGNNNMTPAGLGPLLKMKIGNSEDMKYLNVMVRKLAPPVSDFPKHCSRATIRTCLLSWR